MAEDSVQQEDELALLEAMRKEEEEFQWERTGDRTGVVMGILSADVILPHPSLHVQLNPATKITPSTKKAHNLVSQSVNVAHLPPIKLHFQLPPNYPSSAPPMFTLSCKWLNFTQLSTLCQHLDQIWRDNEGSVILYQWQQFLISESLTTLDIDNTLTITFQNPFPPLGDWDRRCFQEMEHPYMVIPSLLEYDREHKTRLFQMNRFPCEICFLTFSGSQCICLQICSHVHCTECMRAHVRNKIKEGNVTKIECPSSDCTELIPPGLVQELVSPELFERYDRLLLQRTLDGMTDIVYCPRPSCRCVTVKEEDCNMAVCPCCKFSFCILCKRTWHGISPCKLLPDDMKELKEMYDSGDADVRHSLEQQYGRQHLMKAFQEYDSSKWIKSNSKRCPNCQANIEKSHGCNKMTCSNCNCNFCWLCEAMLSRHNPYSHFHVGTTSCGGRLFDGALPDFDDDDD